MGTMGPKVVLLLLGALPAAAQWESLQIRFEGVGCASCIESLPGRVQRIRGVIRAEVDAAAGVLEVRLERDNRVRLEQIRDLIQQDGTKATLAEVEGRGIVTREDGKWVFRPGSQSTTYLLELANDQTGLEPGAGCRVTGRIEDLSGSPPATIQARALARVP